MKNLIIITVTLILIQVCDAQEIVTDIDSNVYKTVYIGTQNWMAENLKTTKYNDDNVIPNVINVSSLDTLTTPYYYWHNNSQVYGILYNWYTINTGKLCPSGWHVPTDAEWTAMENYLIANDYNYDGTTTGNKYAKALASDTGWNSSTNEGAVGNNDYPSKMNASGFSALPAAYSNFNGTFSIGNDGIWWTSSESSTANAWIRFMEYKKSDVVRQNIPNSIGMSVRCIEDPIPDSVKYFGQTPPGNTAMVFAPEILTLTDHYLGQMAFSPDGSELYYGVTTNNGATDKIYHTKFVNSTWIEPSEVSFAGVFKTNIPLYSANGTRIYFTYWNEDYTSNIWMIEQTNREWSEPQILPSPINSTHTDFCYSETIDNVAYISSNRPGSSGVDIWSIHMLADSSYQADNLGPEVNSAHTDMLPCVAPDGSYLIFSSDRPLGSCPQSLWICFKDGNNEWTAPIDMEKAGAKINIPNKHQNCPTLSPDGKYLFFGRHSPPEEPFTINTYWVSTSIIDELKKIAFPTSIKENSDTQIQIFPNPASQSIQIKGKVILLNNSNYQFTNINGKVVKQGRLESEILDISGLSKGIYILNLHTNEGIINKKIVIG